MKVNLYAMYDLKTAVYHAPVCSTNEDSAKRYFATVFANPKNPYYDYYEDYNLMCLGTFSDESGVIDNRDTPPSYIASGQEIAEQARLLIARRDLTNEQ